MLQDEAGQAGGMEIQRQMDTEGQLAVRLIPAGTPEPERTRLQKLLDIIQGQDEEIQAWKSNANHAADNCDDMTRAWREAQDKIDKVYGKLNQARDHIKADELDDPLLFAYEKMAECMADLL